MGVEFTESMSAFLWKYHRDLIALLKFGHIELFTEEMGKEYIKFLKEEWENKGDDE